MNTKSTGVTYKLIQISNSSTELPANGGRETKQMLERTDSWSRLSAGPSTLTDMLIHIYLQGTEQGWPTLS